METLHFVVVVLSFVLLSSVLDQMISRVSLPLVQIGIGLLMAIFISGPLDFSLDPELFLVLFIAPLLYDESRNVSKRLLYRHFSAVLNLAIGLVICSCLAVGFFLNYLEPSIPLTAAFALGAALGPTDAVAVGALSGTVKLNSRQSTLLAGEALINDASGIVSFQFAVAAAVTGAFSLTNAAGAFAVSFLGGLSLGVLLGIISLLILKAVRGIGLESTVFHVTFELLSPFVFFIIAEELHVSGILAVVAGGLLVTLLPQRTSAFAARVRLVSGSVWEVVAFILNGIVFIMLGTQIPGVFNSTWRENSNPLSLIGLVFAITVLSVVLRFVWVLLFDWRYYLRLQRRDKSSIEFTEVFAGGKVRALKLIQNAMVTTLAGPKGAVTLSIAFTLPLVTAGGKEFPARGELIFIASGVILLTLLMANFLTPLLTPAPEIPDDTELHQARARVKKQVIKVLREEFAPGSPLAVTVVCTRLTRQISEDLDSSHSHNLFREIRIDTIRHQMRLLDEIADSGQADKAVVVAIRKVLRRSLLLSGSQSTAHHPGKSLRGVGQFLRNRLGDWFKKMRLRSGSVPVVENPNGMRAMRLRMEEEAIKYLRARQSTTDDLERQVASYLLEDHQEIVKVLKNDSRSYRNDLQAKVDDLEEESLRLQLGCIQDLREDGTLSDDLADALRQEVYLLQMNYADAGH